MTIFRFVSSVTLLMIISACGGVDDAGFDPVPEPELPGTSAEVYCGLVFGCDCASAFPDEQTCIESRTMEWEMQQQLAQDAGLSYDAQCAGTNLGRLQQRGCASTFDSECSSFCSVYHGNVPLGGDCTAPVQGQTWSDCAQGLECNGTCVDPCGSAEGLLGNGELCRGPDGELLGMCKSSEDLFCGENDRCVPFPGVGEQCIDTEQGGGICASGLFCDLSDEANPTCKTAPGPGQPCADGQCSEGNVCVDLTCIALPPAICGY